MTFGKKHKLYETNKIIYIPTRDILPNPAQPRRQFGPEGLRELAESIKLYGVLSPLIVQKRGGGEYELVAGERRLRAAKMAELGEVPCILVNVTGADSSALALIENIHRKDLDFIEEAEGMAKMIRAFGLSQDEMAKRLGKSQSTVANKLRILRLPGELLYIIREAGLTERHARALLRITDEDLRVQALGEMIRREMNVARAESYVDELLGITEIPKEKSAPHTIILKDVRLFLNTVSRGMDIMKRSGIAAAFDRDDTDAEIILTIKIPKAESVRR